MADVPQQELKSQVRDYWNEFSCDTQVAAAEKFSKDYFEQIERFRYRDQPFIHSFAQFTRYHGRRVLEVGFGAGTDFIQWLRAGTRATGVDLTPEALANLSHRIEVYGLPAPEQIMVADAEKLPFPNDSFDLGYSFGVLHHSPDTEKAIAELVRVTRPGGEIKIMVYNRHSVYTFNQWVKHGLLRGKPFQSLATILWNHMESVGTKGYTRGELRAILAKLPLQAITVRTELTSGDLLSASAIAPLNWLYRFALRLAGNEYEWQPEDYVAREEVGKNETRGVIAQPPSREPVFTGNSFGFYHCIYAVKS